ncbi:Microfibrillar-associated protein 1 [Physocladia obscura]|uniref:Microfibrillar-associated protein 1 n=1 Tax=Physocladia obscura TaxID=109957 RepID=A0AAD5SP10_9FUNG|nr:Microfibrillar-associated protein 1 [Physocladia obscura]
MRRRMKTRAKIADKDEDNYTVSAEAEEVINRQDNPEDSDDSEASESDDEDDDSDDESSFPSRPLLKPVFIPKAHRETVLERERRDKELEQAEAKRVLHLQERKIESHNLVEQELQREIAAATVNDTIPDVDDTDGLDEDVEFEAWKLRELVRIKRDRQERDAEERERAETERRRNLTDAELAAENEKIEGKANREDKKSYKFLQKYYHKGAFFADEEILTKRDFNEPTLEDKFDKSILPEVMQVKNFGRSGQTKWTHLSKEDTSSKDSAWFQNSDVNKRTLSKLGGFKQSFEKPTSRKRKAE